MNSPQFIDHLDYFETGDLIDDEERLSRYRYRLGNVVLSAVLALSSVAVIHDVVSAPTSGQPRIEHLTDSNLQILQGQTPQDREEIEKLRCEQLHQNRAQEVFDAIIGEYNLPLGLACQVHPNQLET